MFGKFGKFLKLAGVFLVASTLLVNTRPVLRPRRRAPGLSWLSRSLRARLASREAASYGLPSTTPGTVRKSTSI